MIRLDSAGCRPESSKDLPTKKSVRHDSNEGPDEAVCSQLPSMLFELSKKPCVNHIGPRAHNAATAGTGGTRLLLAICVHANFCSARHTESELAVRRPIWHTPWAPAGVRSDIRLDLHVAITRLMIGMTKVFAFFPVVHKQAAGS